MTNVILSIIGVIVLAVVIPSLYGRYLQYKEEKEFDEALDEHLAHLHEFAIKIAKDKECETIKPRNLQVAKKKTKKVATKKIK